MQVLPGEPPGLKGGCCDGKEKATTGQGRNFLPTLGEKEMSPQQPEQPVSAWRMPALPGPLEEKIADYVSSVLIREVMRILN